MTAPGQGAAGHRPVVDATPWAPTLAVAAGAAAGVLVLVLAVLAGRGDVAVVVAAPLITVVVVRHRRPAGSVRAWFAGPADEVGDDGRDLTTPDGTLRAALWLDAPAGATATHVALTRQGRAVADALVHVDGTRRLPVTTRTVRTGPQEVATAVVQGVGPGAASVAEPADAVDRRTVVLPRAAPLREVPLPPRLRGTTGAHPARRPGEGGDLRDVHPWGPGDRLRRIDWRVTARRSPDLRELYVRREHTLAEAVVVLVVDSRDDVGPDPRTWRGPFPPDPADATSLDRAREAAATLARAFLDQGDRVGLDDLGVRRRPLPPGGGRRQLQRVRHALARTHPAGDPPVRVRAPRLPSGALAVVFSTFLDDEAAGVATQWRAAGHRVVAVDVLPALRSADLSARERLAVRLVTLTREDRVAELADQGVEVVVWRDDPAVALQVLARRGRRHAGAGVV